MIAALLRWLIGPPPPMPSDEELAQMIAEQSPFGGKA